MSQGSVVSYESPSTLFLDQRNLRLSQGKFLILSLLLQINLEKRERPVERKTS